MGTRIDRVGLRGPTAAAAARARCRGAKRWDPLRDSRRRLRHLGTSWGPPAGWEATRSTRTSCAPSAGYSSTATGPLASTSAERAAQQAAAADGPGAVAGAVAQMAERLVGFELQMGPYAVAELRTADLFASRGATPPPGWDASVRHRHARRSAGRRDQIADSAGGVLRCGGRDMSRSRILGFHSREPLDRMVSIIPRS